MKFGSANSVIFNKSSSRTAILQDEEGCSKDGGNIRKSLSILSVADTRDACIDGLFGQFSQVENDFMTMSHGESQGQPKYFKNEPHWDKQKCEKVKRFRFVICALGLAGLGFGLMSRIILNVAIVEMTKSKSCSVIEQQNSSATFELAEDTVTLDYKPDMASIEPIDAECDGLHFDWTTGQQNFLLASFYIGYAPSMFFSGGITDKYGSKLPLLVCIAGSALFNLLTPFIAATNFSLLISSRVVLGTLQGSIVPAIYSLFNSWLTITETSIFIPLAKVAGSIGFLVGCMLPGIVIGLGYQWPFLFYIGGSFCAIWAVIWFIFATSIPQDNRFVQKNELDRIMRKKIPTVSVVKINNAPGGDKKVNPIDKLKEINKKSTDNSIPWLLIITSPSVMALTLVKFTYNLGFDFLLLEQATFLKKVHMADMSTISLIPSLSYLMQMLCITFVGWAAKEFVTRRALGFTVSTWRKIFQSLANFGMAFAYFLLPLAGSNLWIITGLIMAINFHWLMGAGGIDLVPYDLSTKYPATIMGLAHSVSVVSGLILPGVCSLVLGDQSENPERWNTLFLMIGGALAFGNVVFIFVLKAKPFLPGERKEKVEISV